MIRKLRTDELGRMSVEDFRQAKKIPVTVVLDDIRSAMNVGSVFRTADAFAVEKILLCGITAVPPNREITKTAIGATESVMWEYEADIEQVIHRLKESGYQVIAVEQTDRSVPLTDLLPQGGKLAVVFGNEVEGVSNSVLALSDACVEIPQFGTKHSLNVSVCAGIVMWELAKKYRD
jgi:tRNA G18 (ribose-2'-O)-methylase SpoU